MIVGVLNEPEKENRLSIVPEAAGELIKENIEVWIEQAAGFGSFFSHEEFKEKNCKIKSRSEILEQADLILSIQPLSDTELLLTGNKSISIAIYQALQNKERTMNLAATGKTIFSLDLVPRTTRAQSMDILSSMATVAGYKAVLMAAGYLPRFFPMFMSAAGTVPPAKVLILGAGVAGLQAIATARKLGAVVYAFDVRAAAKEEVLSLGGKFVEVEGAADDSAAGGYAVIQKEEFLQRQRQAVHDQAVKSDVIICTAQIPGRPAPRLIFKETVAAMKPGSVIVDLAASSGGNCELTENDQIIQVHQVTIIGNSNLPSDMPQDASKMFSKNLMNFLKLIIKERKLDLNFEDEIVRETCLAHEGKVISNRVLHFFNLND
jgi:H+-translocating NAD(P) transhydrogenase subunit alpha